MSTVFAGPGSNGHPLHLRPEVEKAWVHLRALDPWTLDRQIELTAIPAPPFREAARAERMAELFREVGLPRVRRDEVGNVLADVASDGMPGDGGSSRGGSNGGPVIVSAHLDTVFPEGTEVVPRRKGDRVSAPGISDDGRGLAGLLTLGRVLSETRIPLLRPLTLVATVGEEGPGNLRGVRHLFSDDGQAPLPTAFISLDGVGTERIVIRGVGSIRLRVELRGPGGHSWMDFGRPNPIHLLGAAVARLQAIPFPEAVKSALTVARWGGGSSINSIPAEAWVELDLRSEEKEGLQWLEKEARTVLQGLIEGGAPPGPEAGALDLTVQDIGRRPAGRTDRSHPLVEAAVKATRMVGQEPVLTASSTDANVPMSLGIPAITMGAGGAGGGIHTLEEWYENRGGTEGIFRALLTLLLWEDS
jgi:acetylornithine deacetylase/succinyl-diaminopimelate desuccinylase-like protein